MNFMMFQYYSLLSELKYNLVLNFPYASIQGVPLLTLIQRFPTTYEKEMKQWWKPEQVSRWKKQNKRLRSLLLNLIKRLHTFEGNHLPECAVLLSKLPSAFEDFREQQS